MKTAFMLMAQYETPVVPVDRVVSDYFPHLSLRTFLRKQSDGDIKLLLINMETSQKSAKGVHVEDLATYIDEQRAAAKRDFDKLHSR